MTTPKQVLVDVADLEALQERLAKAMTSAHSSGDTISSPYDAADAALEVLVAAIPEPEPPAESEPFLVEPGWSNSVSIPHTLGPTYRVLFYEDGTARFEHRCDRGDRGVVICAPALQVGGGHVIEQDDPLTISPSILCPDCNTHGFIREGRWVEA